MKDATRSRWMRLVAGLAGLMVAMVMLTDARAQQTQWPTKPVRIIIPYPPGGQTDVVARWVGEKLAAAFGQPFVMDNRPGAQAIVGITAAKQAPGDGYNFLFSWAGTLAVNQALNKTLAYDSQRDFVPIVLLADVPNILVVNNDLPVKNVADLTAHAKANPGKLSFGSTGIGSSMHLAGELYMREYGAQMVHVPFSSPGNATTNLISGEITEGGVQIGDYVVPVPRETLAKAGDEKSLVLGIRPENFKIATEGIGLEVDVVEETGADAYVYGTLAGLDVDAKLSAQQIVARVSARTPPQRGTTVKLNAVDPASVHVFSDKTQERLSA